jgi:hypothetical protein
MAERTVALGDFLTEGQIKAAVKIRDDVARIEAEIIVPNMAEINRRLGQENHPRYLAYAVQAVLQAVMKDNA